MSQRIYIASALKNYTRVLDLRDKLIERGFVLTYDWAKEWQKVSGSGVPESDERMAEIAQLEYEGVRDCDVFLCVLPAGRGGHFELGVAYALGKCIVILDETSGKDKIAFHLLPRIQRQVNEEYAIKDIERTINTG
jgi:nucleoside 2-deoxyribosyltransferase